MRQRYSAVFILLLLVGVVLAMLASGSATAQTPFPTITLLPTFTLPPTAAPTGLPTAVVPTIVGCPPPMPLGPGAVIVVSSGVLLRHQPDTSAPIMEYVNEAMTMNVTGGPTCADNFNWWQVDGPLGPGWVAEGRPERPPGYFIRPIILPGESDCSDPLDFAIGETVLLATGVRVRQEANLDGLVLHVAPQDAMVLLVGGPVCVDGYNWWRVQVPFSGLIIEGWMAEGPEWQAWLLSSTEPTPACSPPIRRLGVGGRGYVNYSDHEPKNLRDSPNINGIILYTLVDGIAFEVIGGPVCADSYNWWYIRILGRPDVTGWLTEGGPGNYWIRPGDPPSAPTATPTP